MNTERQDPFTICGDFLNHKDVCYFIGMKQKDIIDKSLQYAYDTIKAMENDEELENFSYSIIEESLNYMKSITVEQEYVPSLVKFMKAYCYIAHNLNENTIKNDTVRSKIAYLQRYCDNALTYTEYLNMLSILTKRLARLNDWTPPSFRLSEHYYNVLKED